MSNDSEQVVIPGRQRHFSGTVAELRQKLGEREIGLCTDRTDSENYNRCFIKDADGNLALVSRGPEMTESEVDELLNALD